MESSANGIADAARALVQRQRARRVAMRTALLVLAAILATCVGLHAAPVAVPESPETNRQPYLLVASPDMPDPVFQQTVILMLPPATTMPLVAGIVINKPTRITLGQLFSHSLANGNRAQSVYFGGPVDLTSPVILTRTALAPDATRLFENVYISIDAGSITGILKRPATGKDVRLFLGRAQWTVDQLHSEILRGAWTTSPATPEIVFSPDPARVWTLLEQRAKLREIEDDFGTLSYRLDCASHGRGFPTLANPGI